jgi:hypothetical protein
VPPGRPQGSGWVGRRSGDEQVQPQKLELILPPLSLPHPPNPSRPPQNITFCSHIKGTWRKIRPSFLLHGTFDFVLFGLGYFIDGRKPHSDVELVEESEGAQLSPFDNLSIVVGFCSGVVIMCMGLFYYVSIASQQDRRLKQEEFPLLGRLGDERGRGDSIDEDILEMTERAV